MDLSPEAKTALANVVSLLEEVKQMAGAGEGGEAEKQKEEDEMNEGTDKTVKAEDEGSAEDEAEDKKEDEDKAEKADASTADDDAEDRVDDMPELNEESLAAVKTLLAKGAIKKGKNFGKVKVVKKSRTSVDAELYKGLTDLAKVVKAIIEEQKVTKTAVEAIIEGLGYADAIRKSHSETQVVQKGADRETLKKDLLEGFREMLGGKTTVEKSDGKTYDVRKGLADAMDGMFGSWGRN